MKDYQSWKDAFSAWENAEKPFKERLVTARSAYEKAQLEGESEEEKTKKKEMQAQKESVVNELKKKLEEVEDAIRVSEEFPSDELIAKYAALNTKINVAKIWASAPLKPISKLDFARIEYDNAYKAWDKFDEENPMP